MNPKITISDFNGETCALIEGVGTFTEKRLREPVYPTEHRLLLKQALNKLLIYKALTNRPTRAK